MGKWGGGQKTKEYEGYDIRIEKENEGNREE